MKFVDLSAFEEKSTLQFKVRDVHGNFETWTASPPMADRELVIRKATRREFEETLAVAKAAMELPEDIRPAEAELVGAYWAGIIVAAVDRPMLDEVQLVRNYTGTLLRHVGETILDFFLLGRPPEMMNPSTTDGENPET